MAHLQVTAMQDRPTEFLDVTSLTRDEFPPLLPPFEAAFQAHRVAWRLEGTPRTVRPFSVYQNCPLPTPEDRLFFLLTYLKTDSLQVVQGRLFGMRQSKAHQCIHVLLPTLQAALRTLGDAPARSLTARAQRLGVTMADTAAVVTPRADDPVPAADAPGAAPPLSPLLPMTAPNGAASAPKTLLNSPIVLAASNRTTRGKMACWVMPHSRSSFAGKPGEAACMIRAWPRPRRLLCPWGGGCCRTGASWPSRFRRWTSSGRPSHRAARN
jgi:Helix-turn-helix of DDE superfamily endonuclease